ncbi:MAG: hypothetical protein CML02_04155 [Pseudooceanicola sp.]|nr:hypothetical protein [Pseudooceanicola sp.]
MIRGLFAERQGRRVKHHRRIPGKGFEQFTGEPALTSPGAGRDQGRRHRGLLLGGCYPCQLRDGHRQRRPKVGLRVLQPGEHRGGRRRFSRVGPLPAEATGKIAG